MINKKINVLVCGTVFGKIYINGINLNENFKLAGIYSNGSKHSKKIAEQYDVPLYIDINDIPAEEIDLACVVIRSTIVGGKGSEIAYNLLDRGISVIQEQPVHYKEVVRNYDIATQNNIFYSVNTFYSHMEIITKLLDIIRRVNRLDTIYSINCSCSTQTLLPTLDVLGMITGEIKNRELLLDTRVDSDLEHYIFLKMNRVPVMLRIFTKPSSINEINPISSIFNLTISTGIGDIILTDVNGQIIWINRTYIVEEYVKKIGEDRSSEPTSKTLFNSENESFGDIYELEWPKAIKNYLDDYLYYCRDEGAMPSIYYRYLELCDFWKEISIIIEKRSNERKRR